jgi:phage gpG-like protein
VALGSGGYLDIEFTYDGVNGVSSITRKLATFGQSLENMTPAWDYIGRQLLLDFSHQFAQEGGVFGGRWAPLAESTVAQRTRKYGPWFAAHPILVGTGALEASVEQRGAAGNVFQVGANSLTVGTTVPYAVYHNSSGPRTRLPRRQIVGLSNQRIGYAGRNGSIVGILQDYLAYQLRLANLQARGDLLDDSGFEFD